jgi:hypothetical protein
VAAPRRRPNGPLGDVSGREARRAPDLSVCNVRPLGGNREWGDAIAKLVVAAREQGADVIPMSDYLPVQLGNNEWQKWYIKSDGHWSDYGAEIYGRAMYLALRNRLLIPKDFKTE